MRFIHLSPAILPFMKTPKSLSYLAIGIVLLYGLYNSYFRTAHSKHPLSPVCTACKAGLPTHNTRHYIEQVILSGSTKLHFKKNEVMEGGFVSSKDASGVACYVMNLRGEKCAYPQEASLLYSSNCAGCHGNDGKGLHGTYPDLTRRPLLGMQK
jgi:hypothetical protein